MLSAEQLGVFAGAALLVILLPGPAQLFVLSQARLSTRQAWSAVAGLVLGDLLLIAAAALGLAALLAQSPLLLVLLRGAGAAYIAWLGLGLLRSPKPVAASAPPPVGGFAKALLITLGNPKPLLFFAAFFPLFLDPEAPDWVQQFYLLGGLFELINIGSYALLLALFGRLRARLPQSAWLPRACGAGLLCCAFLAIWA